MRIVRTARVFVLGLVFAALLTEQPGQTQSSPPDALPFFKNYFLTGDYQVGSVDLSGPSGGFATGDIHFNDLLGNSVPPGADILGAFLYWEMITKAPTPPSLSGATFRGYDLSSIAKQLGPTKSLSQETSPCWSGSAGDVFELRAYRADVLRFLHVPTDQGGNPAGKRLINDADYLAAASSDPSVLPLRVRLPEASGNQVPSSAGASLVVIYRDPDPARPLKSIVIYNGSHTQLKDVSTHLIEPMTQRVRGFYQLTATPHAKMTHFVASGANNNTERLFVGETAQTLDPTPVATDPFAGTANASSERAWDSPTFQISISGAGGEFAMKVDHTSQSPYDCLNWVGIVFSAEVVDGDRDGLLDSWETDGRYQKITHNAAGDVTAAVFGKCTAFASDPANCVDLPNMGALPNRRDIFIEVAYMHAASGVTYGLAQPVGGQEHDHRPDPEALEKVGKAFDQCTPACGSTAIKVHFDLGDDYPSGTVAEPYLIRDKSNRDLARGGELIEEEACDPDSNPGTCVFWGYPGTIPWKTGFRFLRDEPLSHRKLVSQKDVPDEPACVAAETDASDATNCVRRFDANRKDIFRYSLWAHALGSAKVDDAGVPLLDEGSYIPKNLSGVADGGGGGGGDFMVTLGAFGSHVGSETAQAQAATLMHELGHTLRLRHGAVLGANGIPIPETNCKPNYQSVMNYLYQMRGLIVDTGPLAGTAVVDYSRQTLSVPLAAPSGPKVNENSLSEASGAGLKDGTAFSPYRPRWYSPAGFTSNVSDPATRHCDGTRLTPEEQEVGVTMFTIDGMTAVGTIDWNADGISDVNPYWQDVNFNRGPNPFLTPATSTDGPFSGFNDWANVDLRQVGSRRNVVSSGVGGPLSLDTGLGDFGLGDFGLGDFGLGDFGLGDFGLGDFGLGDFGLGDFGLGDFGQGVPELDLETALGAVAGGAPNGLSATLAGKSQNDVLLRWSIPAVSDVATYEIFRTDGLPSNLRNAVRISAVRAPVREYLDTTVRPRQRYTYFVIAIAVDGPRSPNSNPATVSVP